MEKHFERTQVQSTRALPAFQKRKTGLKSSS
jgi:hypothetical protein